MTSLLPPPVTNFHSLFRSALLSAVIPLSENRGRRSDCYNLLNYLTDLAQATWHKQPGPEAPGTNNLGQTVSRC